jgi:hypothetical protein
MSKDTFDMSQNGARIALIDVNNSHPSDSIRLQDLIPEIFQGQPLKQNPMTLKTNTELSILPQEIVELIIDEVVALKSPETLRTCALVSKSFCFPCRRHLYSDILLVVDRYVQARARRLIKTLETSRKEGFTVDVRSLTLLLYVSSKLFQFISGPTFGSRALSDLQSQKLKYIGFKIIKWLGLGENSLEKLLQLLMTSQLTSFTLSAREGFIDWELHRKGEIRMETFHSLFTHPSLKSLQISQVFAFDNSFVVEALRSNSLGVGLGL